MKLLTRIFCTLAVSSLIAVAVPNVLSLPGQVENVQAAVKISKKSVTLIKGQTTTLKIKGTSQKVKWSSSKKSVANVSSKGKVKAKKSGTTTITAKVGTKKYTCKVTVQAPKLNKTVLSLSVGETYSLQLTGTNKKISWKTSNKNIVSVNKKGNLTAKKAGMATITATVLKKKFKCTVTVKSVEERIPVTSISLNHSFLKIKEGETSQLSASLFPYNATNQLISWTSSNPSVISVDSNGLVTALSAGEAVITAGCDGVTTSCEVTAVINFNSQEALSKLSYESYPVEDGVIVIVKNNYKYTISFDLDCLYYNTSNALIGKTTDSCYSLEPGNECALFVFNPSDSNYAPVPYSGYKLVFNIEESYTIGNVAGISYSANWGADNVMVTVTNNGESCEYTIVAVVFYKNGTPIGYEYHYAEVGTPGSTDYLQYSFPYDSNYETIYPDSYKVFLNASYRYTW